MATGSQLGSAASGAAAGFTYGGWWGAAAGAVLGFLSGDSGADAQAANIYSQYNAIQQRRAGNANAQAIAAMATANAALIMQGAAFNTQIQQQVDQYNAELQSFLGDYNASLLEAEAQQVWETMDLDLLQMGQVFDRELGNLKVGYGASGVIMGEDSPLLAQIDAKTQYELDVLVVRHNADVQAQKLLDAAAKSRWEGNMAAMSIMFEGKMNSISNVGNAALQAAGVVTQGGMDAAMTRYNAGVAATQTSMAGSNALSAWQSQDRQNLVSGIFGAGTTLGASYYQNKKISLPSQAVTKTGVARSTSSIGVGTSPYQRELL